MMTQRRHCGHCHECGAKLRQWLDGEEYCPDCKDGKRYRSHGWGQCNGTGDTFCVLTPQAEARWLYEIAR